MDTGGVSGSGNALDSAEDEKPQKAKKVRQSLAQGIVATLG
jgi:hypothetical protein